MGLFDHIRRYLAAGRRTVPPRPKEPGPDGSPRSALADEAQSLLTRRAHSAPEGTGVHRVGRGAEWYAPGTVAQVHGLTIPDGMVYIGQVLTAPARSSEPALITPRLKVDLRNPDIRGETMGYWPAYSDISPRARGAYLRWLADGRADRSAYIGYVFLFFYGLERRTLVDIPQDPGLKRELPFIRAEVVRLLEIYGDNNSFHGYGSRLLDILDLQLSKDDVTSPPPPITTSNQWNPPMSLVVKLGSLCVDGKPVPADWALAWAWYHPEIRLRTPALRCADEFATLFKTRYAKSFEDGIALRPVKKRVELDYYAASAGIGSVSLQADVPDVFNHRPQSASWPRWPKPP